jgi:splicing factor U2AF subunit
MSRRGRSPPPRPQKSTVSVQRARHAALTHGQDVERAKERVRKRKKAAQEQEAASQGSKVSKWDQAPAGFEGMTVGEVAARAPRLLSLPISSSIVNPNQLRQARRLYVGNIPTKVSRVFLSVWFVLLTLPPQVLSEEALLKFFNTAMVAAGKTGIGERPPVVAAQVNSDKGYAFLEFEHSKICTECMLFDGIILEGNTLKLRRPKVKNTFFLFVCFLPTICQDYVPLPDTYAEEGVLPVRERRGAANVSDLVPGLCSTTVPDSPYKLFAGALPNHLTEEQVKELLCSFGALRGFNMVRDKAKGSYAFFEFDLLSFSFFFLLSSGRYADHTVTDQAVAALHGMKIGDKSLIVQRSSSGGPASSGVPAPASDAAAAHPGAAACLSLQIPLVSILQSLPDIDRNVEPSSMLVLVNLFRPKVSLLQV